MIQIDSVVIAVGDKKEDEVMTLSFDKVIEASRSRYTKQVIRRSPNRHILAGILGIDENKLQLDFGYFSYKRHKYTIDWGGNTVLSSIYIKDILRYSKVYYTDQSVVTLSELVTYLRLANEFEEYGYNIFIKTAGESDQIKLSLDFGDNNEVNSARIHWNIKIPVCQIRTNSSN